VVRGRQREAIRQRSVRLDRLRRLKNLAIAAAEDVGGNHELIAAHGGLRGDLVGVDVDQLHDPVGVGAVGRRNEVGDGLAADLDRLRPFPGFFPRQPASGKSWPGVGNRKG